jgi:hypothetical protein
MGHHYATVTVPAWALRIAGIANALHSTATHYDESSDPRLYWVAGPIAVNGRIPEMLVSTLTDREVPFDFFIQDESGRGLDWRGYWRVGMDEPFTWSEIDGTAFLLAWRRPSAVNSRDTLSPQVAALLQESAPPVLDLRECVEPRMEKAQQLRSVARSRLPLLQRRRGNL